MLLSKQNLTHSTINYYCYNFYSYCYYYYYTTTILSWFRSVTPVSYFNWIRATLML